MQSVATEIGANDVEFDSELYFLLNDVRQDLLRSSSPRPRLSLGSRADR